MNNVVAFVWAYFQCSDCSVAQELLGLLSSPCFIIRKHVFSQDKKTRKLNKQKRQRQLHFRAYCHTGRIILYLFFVWPISHSFLDLQTRPCLINALLSALNLRQCLEVLQTVQKRRICCSPVFYKSIYTHLNLLHLHNCPSIATYLDTCLIYMHEKR